MSLKEKEIKEESFLDFRDRIQAQREFRLNLNEVLG
jgi:hypothetical protein